MTCRRGRHLAKEVFLARKVVVDGLACDAGAGRDMVDARAIAFVAEGLDCSAKQPVLAGFAGKNRDRDSTKEGS
jgi:hypothetical protein